MNIMEQIVASKQAEVRIDKKLRPVKILEKSLLFSRETLSLKQALADANGCGIIAEFKRKSPSKGVINDIATITNTTKAYVNAGANALSVLTNKAFFEGSKEDLRAARLYNACPILCKDFILEEYQVIQARAIGADAILLIAAILPKKALKRLAALSASLGMEVLLEVHEAEELDYIQTNIDVLGVNNRNLKTFITHINTSLELAPLIPSDFVKVSESGITSPETAILLQKAGFDGFLIGEQFMKHSDPGAACASFISTLKKMSHAN